MSFDGKYEVVIEGDLTIHGETQTIQTTGTFEVAGSVIQGKSVFIVKPEDYKIKIPKTVMNNIAEEIEITVDIKLNEYKK